MGNVQIELVFNASWFSVLNEVTIFNATFAGQQVLICDNILWHNPLSPSLQALSISIRSDTFQDNSGSMLQLFTTLRSLTALEHFDLKSDQAPLLPELFKALNECALTHLALSSCKLAGLPQDCDLPSSLEVVDLAYNPALYTERWLLRMSTLPVLRAINIHGSTEIQAVHGSLAVFSDPIFVASLESLWLDSDVDMERLQQTRETLGLPRLACAADGSALQETWLGYRAILNPPPIRYGPCALLRAPQLDEQSPAS